MSIHSITHSINDTQKFLLYKIINNYLYIGYTKSIENKERVYNSHRYHFQKINSFYISIDENDKFVFGINCKINETNKHKKIEYSSDKLSDAKNYIDSIMNYVYSFKFFNELPKNNTKSIPNTDDNLLKPIEIELLNNSFYTINNVSVSELFSLSYGYFYYYKLSIINYQNSNLLVLYTKTDGYHTQLEIFEFTDLILLEDNYCESYKDRYDLNFILINEGCEKDILLKDLNLDDYKKLFNWIDERKYNF